MPYMTRTRAVVVLCLSAALALTACGAPQAAPSVPAAAGIFDGVDAELVALEAAGLVEEEAAPAPSASADKRERVRPRAIRKHLRKNTLHGEVTVETKEGTRTVVVQRGSTLDGLGKYLRQAIRQSPLPPVDVARVLKETGTEVVVCYLPVGSEEAARWCAEQAWRRVARWSTASRCSSLPTPPGGKGSGSAACP